MGGQDQKNEYKSVISSTFSLNKAEISAEKVELLLKNMFLMQFRKVVMNGGLFIFYIRG